MAINRPAGVLRSIPEARFTYNGNQTWADLAVNGTTMTVAARYLYGAGEDQLLARDVASGTSPGVSWYLTDHLGSVRDILSGDGSTILDHIEYNVNGMILSETNAAFGDRFKFTGREFDARTRLQYNRARYYLSALGVWMERDPSSFKADDANLYRYGGNDFANVTDPSGLYGVKDDWLAQCSNFFANTADTVSVGTTTKLRQLGGYDDVVDKTSAAYRYGGYAGQAINIGLMFANPQAMASGLRSGLSWINTLSKASSMADMATQALQGNLSGVGMAALSMVPSVLRGAGSGCGATLFERGMQLYGMAGGAVSGAGKMWNGDIIGGLLDIAQAGASAYRFMQSCFAAGTMILTKRGWVAIETLHVGDEVWSKPEDDPNAPGALKRVEELFVRTAMLLRVQVGGKEILTTAEHPFYIRDKGWVPAGFVEAGQQVVGRDGECTTVEAIEDTRKVATVYNCRVAEYHTYYVGGEEWGFSVWRIMQAKDMEIYRKMPRRVATERLRPPRTCSWRIPVPQFRGKDI